MAANTCFGSDYLLESGWFNSSACYACCKGGLLLYGCYFFLKISVSGSTVLGMTWRLFGGWLWLSNIDFFSLLLLFKLIALRLLTIPYYAPLAGAITAVGLEGLFSLFYTLLLLELLLGFPLKGLTRLAVSYA